MTDMNRSLTPSRMMLLTGSTSPSAGRAGVAVKRYRLARARLDGRPVARPQSSASEPARESRSASLIME
jgi:arylsulfatase A-like enzyme